MSLIKVLTEEIKSRHGEIFRQNELEDICHKMQYKLSNAERRLRPSESPNIERIWNEKKTAIIGYRWKESAIVKEFQDEYKQRTKDRAERLNPRDTAPQGSPMPTLW